MARRGGAPEVNAGSMADIAFLLLIFFLVTTTIETDAGLDRKLPPMDDATPEDVIIKQKNIFTVEVNKNNQLLVEENLMRLEDLRAAAVKFLDNGGGVGEEGERCDYCRGDRDPASSDHPNKAVISLRNDRLTQYSTYIAVQNELVAAYNELRNREAERLFGRSFTDMEADYLDPKTQQSVKDELKPRIERIQGMYPQKLSEAEPKSN
ncbi:ExbD/TolR family protein [Robertkochia sediminum]|uniref:ExbD/TolR family protein n=1 Tax=Robertkochia sediminum TaxID=2785326 RepID=UPI001931B611|nr:biopolymer transporter ExbD [Robertkochia sediminum]MBL7473890.1 biopolymer transporter ExbD [Robertkochia sediminum]